MYIEEVEARRICPGQGVEPTVVKETVATALVDGNNLLGKISSWIWFYDGIIKNDVLWHKRLLTTRACARKL